MEYFEVPQIKFNPIPHIEFMDQHADKFQHILTDNNQPHITYIDRHSQENNNDFVFLSHDDKTDLKQLPFVKEITDQISDLFDIQDNTKWPIQYIKMSPNYKLDIHSDVNRKCGLMIELKSVGGSISWYDSNKTLTKTLKYTVPAVCNTEQLHSASGGSETRYQLQIDMNYNFTTEQVYQKFRHAIL